RAQHRSLPRRGREPRELPLPAPLPRADGRRVAAFRHAVRPLLRGQPHDPAQRPQHALAAALAAAVRARRVPVLPGARVARGAAAERVVVLAPDPREIILALGAKKQIAGYPVDSEGRIHWKQVRKLRPDLIVATPNENELLLSRAARQTHADVYEAPDISIDD